MRSLAGNRRARTEGVQARTETGTATAEPVGVLLGPGCILGWPQCLVPDRKLGNGGPRLAQEAAGVCWWGSLAWASLPWGTVWGNGLTRCMGPGKALQGWRGPRPTGSPSWLDPPALGCCSPRGSSALGGEARTRGWKEIPRWVQEGPLLFECPTAVGHPPARAHLAALGREGLASKHLPEDQGQEADPGRARELQAPSPTPGPSCEGVAMCYGQLSRSGQGWGPRKRSHAPVPRQSLQSCLSSSAGAGRCGAWAAHQHYPARPAFPAGFQKAFLCPTQTHLAQQR